MAMSPLRNAARHRHLIVARPVIRTCGAERDKVCSTLHGELNSGVPPPHNYSVISYSVPLKLSNDGIAGATGFFSQLHQRALHWMVAVSR